MNALLICLKCFILHHEIFSVYLTLYPHGSYSQVWNTHVETNSSGGKTRLAYIEGKSNNAEKPSPRLQASFNYSNMMTRWHLVNIQFINCKIGEQPILIKFSGEDKLYKAYGWGEKKSNAVWIQLLPDRPLAADEISGQDFLEKIRVKKAVTISFVTESGTV